MTSTSPSEKDLLIADLRLRLGEAEETLRAIRENEVDALVMRGHTAEEIFTIVGDTESYRTFMEVMEPGAAALDGFGRVLYANSTLTHLLGKSLAELQGKLVYSFHPKSAVMYPPQSQFLAVDPAITEAVKLHLREIGKLVE